MEIENTPLAQEARSIIASGQTQTNFGWRAIIHYGEQKTYAPLMVIAVAIRRDYVGAFTDEMTCTLLIPLGKYARQIYPNRGALQVSLFKLPITEAIANVNEDGGVESERYSATLIDQGPAVTQAQGTETNDEDALDMTDLLEVNFQLFNKSLEQLRMVTVGGIFRRTTVSSLLLAMLTKESQSIDVDDVRVIEGVDLVPASNDEVKEQLVVTHGTKLVDVADYLQKRIGIYSSGLGSYIQNKHWFIFPLYDTTQFEDRQNTLTIIVLPTRKFNAIERTYRQVGNSLTVLMTGETGFKDDSGTQYLNEGNGARFADASRLLENGATTAGNKTVMARGKNNSEFIADTRTDGLNNVPVPEQRITANPFAIYSKLNARNGGTFKGVWQNSEFSLIVPGMVTRVLYSDEGEVVELFGVVHFVDHLSHKEGDFGSKKFSNQSVVTVFVNKAAPQ